MHPTSTETLEAFDTNLFECIQFSMFYPMVTISKPTRDGAPGLLMKKSFVIIIAKQDAVAIQNVAVKLGRHLSSIVETVREQLSSHFPEKADDVHVGNEPLRRYLGRIMTGLYDARFSGYLKWIANEPKEIDPVYVNATLGTLHSILIQQIHNLKLVAVAESSAIGAFTKLLWLQSHYFLQRYSTMTTRAAKHARPTVSDFVYGIPAFLRECPAFPVVLGATLGGVAVWISFRKKWLA